jgi:hypothetical protein
MKYVYISFNFFSQTIVRQFEFRNRYSRQHMIDLITTLVENDVPFNVEYSGAIDDNTGLALP